MTTQAQKEVKIGFRIRTHPNMTPEEFFCDMPYMLQHFNFRMCNDPDFLICYHQDQIIPQERGKKIFYCQELVRPSMGAWDYGLVWEYEDYISKPERCLRFPDYVKYGAGKDLIKPSNYDPEKIAAKKTKFCAFVYNHNVPTRNQFFKQLSAYKHVDSPGTIRNNMLPISKHKTTTESRYASTWRQEVIDFLKPYKFVICFEHSCYPGHTSEKIYHAMLADCIPIYCGNQLVHRDYNTKSFINTHDFSCVYNEHSKHLIMQRIQELDKNPKLYKQMLSEPWYMRNKLNPFVEPANIINFFEKMFHTS